MKQSDKIKIQKITLETAQRLIDYDSYGKSMSKAISAIKRRFPGLPKSDYKKHLEEAITVHKEAIEFVRLNSEKFYQSYKEKPDGSGLHSISTDFVNKYSSYQAEELTGTLGFIFYIYHLR